MLFQIGLQSPAGKIPELDEAVVAGRGGELAIIGGLDRPHGRRVAGEVTGPVAIGRIPDRGIAGAVEEALTAGGEELGAVGGVVGGDHPARVGREIEGGSRGSGRGGILGGGPASADRQQDDDRGRSDEAVRTKGETRDAAVHDRLLCQGTRETHWIEGWGDERGDISPPRTRSPHRRGKEYSLPSHPVSNRAFGRFPAPIPPRFVARCLFPSSGPAPWPAFPERSPLPPRGPQPT